jgi:hypothetical protein
MSGIDRATRDVDGRFHWPSALLSSAVAASGAALVLPWTLHRRATGLAKRSAFLIAGVSILIAAGLSTTLSAWTYLAGKGLLLTTNNEMDLGSDDLPPDSIGQVAMGIAGSLLTWVFLLSVALLLCAAVADWLYRTDRDNFRVAVRGAGAASVWLVVWAFGVLVANGIREREFFHPAEAIRGYAQLNQQGFRGSSAMAPGPLEREPLAGRGRLAPLALVFPVIWGVGLPPRRGTAPSRRWVVACAAIGLSWLAWWTLWRILPWIKISALVG